MASAQELLRTGAVRDAAHSKLVETRKVDVSNWMRTADALDAQGEIILAGEVRYFAIYLPPVLTHKEKLAARFIPLSESLHCNGVTWR
jgi:hypothetical protein